LLSDHGHVRGMGVVMRGSCFLNASIDCDSEPPPFTEFTMKAKNQPVIPEQRHSHRAPVTWHIFGLKLDVADAHLLARIRRPPQAFVVDFASVEISTKITACRGRNEPGQQPLPQGKAQPGGRGPPTDTCSLDYRTTFSDRRPRVRRYSSNCLDCLRGS
jgi:hypothetical protein